MERVFSLRFFSPAASKRTLKLAKKTPRVPRPSRVFLREGGVFAFQDFSPEDDSRENAEILRDAKNACSE